MSSKYAIQMSDPNPCCVTNVPADYLLRKIRWIPGPCGEDVWEFDSSEEALDERDRQQMLPDICECPHCDCVFRKSEATYRVMRIRESGRGTIGAGQ